MDFFGLLMLVVEGLGIKPPKISPKADPMVQASPFECWAVQFLRMSAHLLCLMCASRARWPLEIVQVAVWRKNYQFW